MLDTRPVLVIAFTVIAGGIPGTRHPLTTLSRRTSSLGCCSTPGPGPRRRRYRFSRHGAQRVDDPGAWAIAHDLYNRVPVGTPVYND